MSDSDAAKAITSAYPHSAKQLKQYVDLLTTTGVEWGLLGPREPQRLWSRHIGNSVALTGLVSEGASVIDVGSGAGLPGLALSLIRPDLDVVLLEPLLRRVKFLELAVQELGVSERVTVVRSRAEEHSGHYSVAIARAVAPLPRLMELLLPLADEILALKGASAEDEVAAARKSLSKQGVSAVILELSQMRDVDPTRAVRIARST